MHSEERGHILSLTSAAQSSCFLAWLWEFEPFPSIPFHPVYPALHLSQVAGGVWSTEHRGEEDTRAGLLPPQGHLEFVFDSGVLAV